MAYKIYMGSKNFGCMLICVFFTSCIQNGTRLISVSDVAGVYTKEPTTVIQLCVDGRFNAFKFPLRSQSTSVQGLGSSEVLVDSSGTWAILPTNSNDGDAIVSLTFTSTVTGVTKSLTEGIYFKRKQNEALLLQIVGDPDDNRRNVFKLQTQSPVC